MIARDVLVGASIAIVSAVAACSRSSAGRAAESKLQQAGALHAADSGSASAEFVVDTTTVDLPLDLPAQLYVEHDAVVVARSQGTVDSLLVELGDRVVAGQLLAKLESTDQEIALASADALFENLGHAVTRARVLTKVGGTTAADSEQVEHQLRQADIARRKARRDLELTRVVAPFDGVVSARFVRPRRFVAVGDTLFRVSETSPLYARVRIPETRVPFVRIGDRATVIGANGERGAAAIVHAAPVIEAASGTREMVLRLVAPDPRLVAGAGVRVQLGRERRHVVSVPRAAIASDGYALVVDNGRVTLRPVIVGADLGAGRVEIVSGLSLGERLARPAR